MQIRNFTLLFAICLLAACSTEPNDQQPTQKSINVVVGSDPGIDIKPLTALGEDGISVYWTKSDTIAMWATSQTNGTAFAAKPFAMWHYNADFNAAKFTADIDPMPKDTYTYYAVSPRPQSVAGALASFTIPAQQSGVFDPLSAVMVAAPVEGPALIEGDNSKAINLRFKHKVHILKITIPENRLGLPVTALELQFPVDVVGRLTVNAADDQAAGVLSQSSNTLTLNFATPIDAGATVIATIAPVELLATDKIQIKAISGKKESVVVKMNGKNFRESHTTPIELTIPELYRCTRVVIQTDSDGSETIGEQIQNVILTAPEGVDLGGGSNVHTFAYSAENSYMLSYEGEFIDQISGKNFTITYDSESAAISRSFTMPQIVVDEINELGQFTVPYLFEEDFSGVNGERHDDDKGTGNGGGYELSSLNIPKWSGQRIGSKQGVAIRINSRRERTWNIGYDYDGRVTSPALTNLKKEATVTVNFCVGGATGGKGLSRYQFGTTTSTGNPIFSEGMTDIGARTEVDKSSDYDNIPATPHTRTFAATNQTRMSWKVSNSSSYNEWVHYYLYIDNIKVSITK